MIAVSQHFDIREFVAPTIYNHPAIGDRCVHWVNQNLFVTAEQLFLEFADKPIINDWHKGGSRKNQGLRDFHYPEGASYSGHYFGNCMDPTFAKTPVVYVFKYILDHQDKFPFIIRLEPIAKTPTWVHIEVGHYKRLDEIKIINM